MTYEQFQGARQLIAEEHVGAGIRASQAAAIAKDRAQADQTRAILHARGMVRENVVEDDEPPAAAGVPARPKSPPPAPLRSEVA